MQYPLCNMLNKERMYKIMALLNEQGFVSVKELMDNFQVSRSSVMRDLIDLENQGLIQREHGGACLKNIERPTLSSLNEIPVSHKETVNVENKMLVCKEAAKKIYDGDCIYIDSGTTPVFLLPHIIDKRIKIVTASTYLIRKIPDSFKGDIYLLGGEFKKDYDMSFGPLTLQMIKQFNFDQAFFSTNGVSLKTGEVNIFKFSIGAVKREIMKRSLNNHLLIDDSKFGVKALCTWAHTDEFNTIYVNDFPKDVEVPDNYYICNDE